MTHDQQTGEVIEHKRMPPEIAQAIVKIKAAAGKLVNDEKNEHGKYNYVSVDAFFARFQPLMSEHGLFTMIDEVESETQERTSRDERGQERRSTWLFQEYEVWLCHVSGAMWGPMRKHLALPISGPQAYGAAESYVQKRLLRGIFMVPTGEADADSIAQTGDAPTRRAYGGRARPVAMTVETPTEPADGLLEELAWKAAEDGMQSLQAFCAGLRPQERASIKQLVVDKLQPYAREMDSRIAALERVDQ